ncbi:MAG: lysozyme [Prochloraceae cyanobacterium]|nr:lysozyme [Prochloraceae cyanobacterium]
MEKRRINDSSSRSSCGYDDEAYDGKGAFICCDPWGEYFSSGYQYGTNQSGDSRGDVLGDHVSYSYRFARNAGFYWSHAVSHPTIKLVPETVTPKNSSSSVSVSVGNTNTNTDSEIPQCGIDLIKEFEGCHELRNDGRVYAYPDPLSGDRQVTIGYGSTYKLDGSPFKYGDSISIEEAEKLLKIQLKTNYWDILEKTIPYWNQMNNNQRGALLSFAYNLGAYFYRNSGFPSMTRVLKNKQWSEVPETMYKYRNPGTNVEEGLARRRKAEGKLWSTPTI